MSAVTRKLNIQVSSAKRLLNEYKYYQEEETTEKKRLEQMIKDGVSVERQKQQKNVIKETSSMIPLTRRQLYQSIEALKLLLKDHGSSFQQVDVEKAQQVLSEADKLLSN